MQRIKSISNIINPDNISTKNNSFSIKDNRTGKSYKIPIINNFIRSSDLLNIKDKNDQVTRYYDPGYTNTICCTSKIGYIDGNKGILQYRGYPIEVIAEKSTFTEVAYLLIYGELPTTSQLQTWEKNIMNHTIVGTEVENMTKSFENECHPMGMLVSMISAVSTLYPDQNPALHKDGVLVYQDEKLMNKQIYRLLGQ